MTRHRISYCCLLAATIGWSGATAQSNPIVPTTPLGGEPPTSGVRLHAPAVTGSDDASAIEVNPGALGMLPAWSVLLHHSELRSDGRLQGGGDALFAGVPLPIYRRLVFGIGLQWLRPPPAIGYADSVKLSFAAAWRPARSFSLGLAYHTIFAHDEPHMNDLNTLDVGLVVRPYEWVALGLAVRNITAPTFDGMPLQRTYDTELTVRPLSTRQLEIGAGFQVGERRGNFDPHFRILVEPWWGIRFFSHLELVRRDFYRTNDPLNDIRASLGLSFSLQRLGFATSAAVGRSLDSGPGPLGDSAGARSAFQGMSFSLQLHGERQQTVAAPSRVVEVVLRGKLTQRKLIATVQLLRAVERQQEIIGVLLLIDGLRTGWAQIQELRNHITRLRRARKHVIAFVQSPNAKQYYLAAAAERVLLDPSGDVRLRGIASSAVYLRQLLDTLGVRAEIIKIAEYKSAPEPLTRRGPSKPAQQMREALVDDIFGQIVGDLASNRRQSVQAIRAVIDRGPFTPHGAIEAKLVDELVDREELRRRVQRLTSARVVDATAIHRASSRWPGGPAIAVILIEGDIVHGKSTTIPLLGRSVVGDQTIIASLRQARTNPRIKAIVLRIDSPGGSAMASEKIWRAVKRTRKVKPVIVSMADTAASGGYYAAAAADHIFALPATLTGSIGLFSGKLDLSGLLAKLGIATHTTARGKRATMSSPLRPYSAEERKVILSRLQYRYRSFLAAVAQGRKTTADQIHRVARGRVWTGRQARTHKLVDAHGGLAAAVDEGKRRAKLGPDRPVELVVLPKQKRNMLVRALELLGSGTANQPSLPESVRQQLSTIPPVLWHARSDEPLARVPYQLDF